MRQGSDIRNSTVGPVHLFPDGRQVTLPLHAIPYGLHAGSGIISMILSTRHVAHSIADSNENGSESAADSGSGLRRHSLSARHSNGRTSGYRCSSCRFNGSFNAAQPRMQDTARHTTSWPPR